MTRAASAQNLVLRVQDVAVVFDQLAKWDIARYLSQVSRLYLNTEDHSNGPGNSLVLRWIEWSRIKPIREFPNEP